MTRRSRRPVKPTAPYPVEEVQAEVVEPDSEDAALPSFGDVPRKAATCGNAVAGEETAGESSPGKAESSASVDDPYDLLGVSRDDSTGRITRRYFELVDTFARLRADRLSKGPGIPTYDQLRKAYDQILEDRMPPGPK